MLGKWYVTTTQKPDGSIIFRAERRVFTETGAIERIEGGHVIATAEEVVIEGKTYYIFEGAKYWKVLNIAHELADRLNRPLDP